MTYRIILALVLLLALPALAAPADPLRLTWQHPTTRVDGTPLPVSEIAGYRLYYTVDGDIPTDPDAPFILLAPGTSETIPLDLPYRAEPYVLRAALRTVSTFGKVSELSITGVTERLVHPAAPGAPTEVIFEIVIEE